MIKKIVKTYNIIEEKVASTFLFAAVCLVFLSVVMRYVLFMPLPWCDEVYNIFFAWAITLGYSITQKNDEHIKMDIVDVLIKNSKISRIIDIIAGIFCIIFAWILCYYGFLAMIHQLKMGRVTPILMIPRYILYSVVPFTGLILIIRYGERIIRLIKTLIGHKEVDQLK